MVSLKKNQRRKWTEEAIRSAMFLCAFVSILTTVAIIWILARESWAFFQQVNVLSFLTGTRWTPLLEPRSFGVLPLLGGTLLVVAGAALVSLPLGLASAMYLSEHASERMRGTLKPILEVLAGIPTVVYG